MNVSVAAAPLYFFLLIRAPIHFKTDIELYPGAGAAERRGAGAAVRAGVAGAAGGLTQRGGERSQGAHGPAPGHA
eukprot:1294392-Pyramimonas_sp.AAC.2